MLKPGIKGAIMSRATTTLYTQDQLSLILAAWGCTESLPKKGNVLYICFANSDCDLAEVERSSLKSESGKPLWRVTLSSRAGRAFDAIVQESHVVMYREHRMAEYRRENRARHSAIMALANA